MRLKRSTKVRLACCAVIFPLALASCWRHRARLTTAEAACAHYLATAHAALATPPDSIAGMSHAHAAHASAMAEYHACLDRR